MQKIAGNFENKHIVSVEQFDKKDFEILFKTADRIKKLVKRRGGNNDLKHKIMTALFYEPSSRTFASFIAAMQRLGGGIIPIQDIKKTSVWKGESLADTVRTFGCYSDVLVLRHPKEGSAEEAASVSYVPIINAGDGGGNHPTQTLLDLYTIHNNFGGLEGLIGILAGDPLHSRTIKSLLRGLALYSNNTAYLLSPKELRIPRALHARLTNKGLRIIEIEKEKDIPSAADFWYWNRIQKERFEQKTDQEALRSAFIVTKKLLKDKGSKRLIILDSLPRIDEIDPVVDSDPRAIYLNEQMRNGLYIRMALLKLVLA